jgi:hypothetical protein
VATGVNKSASSFAGEFTRVEIGHIAMAGTATVKREL